MGIPASVEDVEAAPRGLALGEAMKIVRIILLVVIVLIAALVAISALNVKTPTATAPGGATFNTTAMLAAAEADYTSNTGTSENVYQQQVVGLWGIKDLVMITAQQNDIVIKNQNDMLALQKATLDGQNSLFSLLKSFVLIAALIVAAVVVIGATLLDRNPKDPPAPEVAALPAQFQTPPTLA